METIIQVLQLILIFSAAIIYAYWVAYYVSKGYHRAKREEELKRQQMNYHLNCSIEEYKEFIKERGEK